ncbi:MAG: hypothetical protein JWM42_2093 [Burkholderia sp.]|nr:hypothetical protein [Burkholderia sp.]
MHVFHRITALFSYTALALAIMATPAAQAQTGTYQQRNLASDGFVTAENKDPNLVNSWGIAFNPFGPAWVANAGSGAATMYDAAGKPQSLVVQIPAPANASGKGSPTGAVYNASPGFIVSNGATQGPSRFLFATEEGVIAGWAPNVDDANAIRAVDYSAGGAIYKGLALSAGGSGSRLYAADFHNTRVDVFDSEFKPVTLAAGAFTDPSLPAGFAPFGLQAINGDIYVSYARQDADKHDDVAGPGLGYINVFDPDGRLIRRVASQGELNAPWGMALAPAGFGKFAGRLLVGNFGDGMINAFDLATGTFVGKLESAGGMPIQIAGLWGIAFGNGFLNQSVDTLFFAAGPGEEEHGLYGRIDAVPAGTQGTPGQVQY